MKIFKESNDNHQQMTLVKIYHHLFKILIVFLNCTDLPFLSIRANFYAVYNWFEFRIFFLLDWLHYQS